MERILNMVWPNGRRKPPGGSFAPSPVNTLHASRNQALLPFPRPKPPSPTRNIKASPPPPKRQKVQESPNVHTEAHFALQPQFEGLSDPLGPRKRSASDSVHSASDTHHTISGQSSRNKSNSQNVEELRQVEKYARPPGPKRPRHKKNGGRESAVIVGSDDDDRDPLADDDDDDDEVRIVRHPNNNASFQQRPRTTAHQGDIGLDTLGSRFQSFSQNLPQGKGLHSIVHSATKKRPYPDNSIDELSVDVDDGNPTRTSMSRAQPKSSSLSTRGDVRPTQFTGTKSKPQLRKATVSNMRDTAAGIIGPGLKVTRAINGPFGYHIGPPEPSECFLSVRELSSILHPTNHHGDVLDQCSYLKINLNKVHDISVPSTPEDRIVCISRASEPNYMTGAKLYVEFSSPSDVQRFSQWAEMSREQSQTIKLKKRPGVELEKEFNNCAKSVGHGTVLRDRQEDEPDDVKLMKHNARARGQGNEVTISTQYRPQAPARRKLKDEMQSTNSSTARDEAYEVPESPPQSREPRPARMTRSAFVPKEPTPEPELPSWTASNPDWERRWRNSLIFPSHGKSRATVDKDDIERLDEGQFLNDNIVIFYLRYLQHKLETELPDQAQRIYFQNTFFFDKLKPTKASGGINYDSVKGWTSKVDLFMKDYIVVPINEYSHWYVAIIYNAPKLIPSETELSDTHSLSQNSVIIEDDGKTPQSTGISNQPEEHSNAQDDVEAGISHDTNHRAPQEATEASKDNRINLTQEPEGPLPEADKTQTSGGLGHKRAVKRKSIGPRRYDPDQPRIITLDSLGGSHSPACNFLKQYLVAELKDKKGIEIPSPGALGMTAKNIPLQSNYCDCGLYLLGYIQEFLKDPDRFIRSILQYEKIPWESEPSDLRNRIRDVIFELQEEQQKREDAHKEEKRQAALSKRARVSRPSSRDEPKGESSPAKPKREAEAETETAQEVMKNSHNTKLEDQDVAPKKSADISSFFRRDGNKTDSTKGHPDLHRDISRGSSIVAQPGVSSSPEPDKPELPPSGASRRGHIPGSLLTSPPKDKRTTIDIPSLETLQDSTDESERIMVSPLKSSPRTSPHKPTIHVNRDRGQRADSARRESVVGSPVAKTPKKLTNGVHLESPRQHRETHSESHAGLSPQETSTSHFFAGRQEGDTNFRAKCVPKSVERDIVELSD